MNMRRQLRTALITGGASGIGLAIAKKMAYEGVRTTIADINPPAVTIGSEINYINCDIASGKAVDDLYATMYDSVGLPDILVCNAGRGIHEKLTEGDPEKWEKTFSINVLGALRCIRSFVPAMLAKKSGDVVFISSVSANQPYQYGGVYAAAKTALEVIAETLRLETIPWVRVTVVAPGATQTNFFSNLIAGYQSPGDMDFKPLVPEEIAESVWFAINRPKEVSINRITVRPTPQVF